jgi:NAD(P)-dependent dehydrogenase (short-subunit alcohol dehydrogenase family)
MDINDTSGIVTGGASGLGEATARLLAERRARVVVARNAINADMAVGFDGHTHEVRRVGGS